MYEGYRYLAPTSNIDLKLNLLSSVLENTPMDVGSIERRLRTMFGVAYSKNFTGTSDVKTGLDLLVERERACTTTAGDKYMRIPIQYSNHGQIGYKTNIVQCPQPMVRT